MAYKSSRNLLAGVFLIAAGIFVIPLLISCGKQSSASPAGLNVRYRILNLSPDLGAINLFIDFKQVNSTKYIFGVDQGYFYVPSIDTPFQIRSALIAGTELFSRDDILKTADTAAYTLYITGTQSDGSLKQVFTVDTAVAPKIGRGKLRFVNVSPTGSAGLDVYANNTLAFSKIIYGSFSNYIELPVGNYDLQINTTGVPGILKDMPGVTIQDGKLYTLYAYGYTSRTDTAAFNAAMITNR